MAKPETALISTADKRGLEEFGDSLVSAGFDIIGSEGTAARLNKAGIPATNVAEFVGGGPILGHRVVTISREIAAGLLATDSEEDEEELKRLGIPRIDLVRVDMYPLDATIANPDSTEEDVTEATDIGGPNLLRMGAKGRRIVIPTFELQNRVLEWLDEGRPNEKGFRRMLAAEAEFEAARYVLESAKYLGGSAVYGFAGRRIFTPRYGENGWQEAGLFSEAGNDNPLAFSQHTQVQGKELSANNIIDAIERGAQTLTHAAAAFNKRHGATPPIAVGMKHGNACGAGVGNTPVEATRKMLDGDLESIFGGVVSLNYEIDAEVASTLLYHQLESGVDKRFLEVVSAPSITEEAREILSASPNLRVLINPALDGMDESSLDRKKRSRYVNGDLLVQDNYTFVADLEDSRLEIWGEEVGEQEKDDMILAWAIGSTSTSNTITLVRNGMLIANGVGQQARHIAAWLAASRAEQLAHDLEGAVAYSDSFFPKSDGALILINAGVKTIFGLRGSNNDINVRPDIENFGGTQYTLPNGEARGFYGH